MSDIIQCVIRESHSGVISLYMKRLVNTFSAAINIWCHVCGRSCTLLADRFVRFESGS
jgi:hypothetical protein